MSVLIRGTTFRGTAGFTLIELLAALVIVGLLLATFVPYALSIRESSNRVRCTANLNRIWRAVRESYMPANGYMWPRVRSDSSTNGWTAFTGADDANPFATDSTVAPNDVTASLWLLVREGLAQPDWFVCPSGNGSPDRITDAAGEQTVVKRRGNFRSPDNLNYGYSTPFSSIPDYRVNDTLPPRFVFLADQGPSVEAIRSASDVRFDASPRALRRINSPNHGGAGQNVLYGDGSIAFETTPYCGVARTMPTHPDAQGRWVELGDGNNIYTALNPRPLLPGETPKDNAPGFAATTAVGPAYKYDVVLVPGASFTPGSREQGNERPSASAVRPATTTIETTTTVPATSPATSSTTSTTIPAATLPTTVPATQP